MNLFSQWPGELGTYQTVSMMRNMVNRSYLDPVIRERATGLIIPCGRDLRCHHRRLQSFVSERVQYVKDPQGVEALHDPITFYEDRIRKGKRAWGDCDDMSVYLATLLKSIGHNPMFRIVGSLNFFHHIFVICEGENLDPTMKLEEFPLDPGRSIMVLI